MPAKKQEPEEGERRHFGFRVTPEMKAHIEAAAKASGRSMSQEVEFRLELSFDRIRLLPEVLRLAFGELGGIVLLVAHAMDEMGRLAAYTSTNDIQSIRGGSSWLTNPVGFDAAAKAANAVLEAARPYGEGGWSSTPKSDALNLVLMLANDEGRVLLDVKEALPPATLRRITRRAKQAASEAPANE